jgi:hypothetical protein
MSEQWDLSVPPSTRSLALVKVSQTLGEISLRGREASPRCARKTPPGLLVRPVKLVLFFLLVTGLASLFAGNLCSPFGLAGPARLEFLDRQTGQSIMDTQ